MNETEEFAVFNDNTGVINAFVCVLNRFASEARTENDSLRKQLSETLSAVKRIEERIFPQKSHYQTKKEYLGAKADAYVNKDKYTAKRK